MRGLCHAQSGNDRPPEIGETAQVIGWDSRTEGWTESSASNRWFSATLQNSTSAATPILGGYWISGCEQAAEVGRQSDLLPMQVFCTVTLMLGHWARVRRQQFRPTHSNPRHGQFCYRAVQGATTWIRQRRIHG
jgi:hypothetical protein